MVGVSEWVRRPYGEPLHGQPMTIEQLKLLLAPRLVLVAVVNSPLSRSPPAPPHTHTTMLARRSVLTVARVGRAYSTAANETLGNEFLAQRAAVKEHAKGALAEPMWCGAGER